MKIIIVGCGKLGSGLAKALTAKGHKVTIIDSDPAAFRLLGADFSGTEITGIGFDRDILEQAGISRADAIIASSKSDATNALIGKIARDIYRVPRVISRLYDPRRADIYRSLGIQTISTTTWGIQHAMEMLSYDRLDTIVPIGNGQVELIRAEVPALLVGRTVRDVTVFGEIQVVSVSRSNKTFIPTLGTPLEKHDVLYFSVLDTAAKKLKHILGLD